ncbi:Slx4p interacting protein [Puttea exsequens]|nr:Slx4p interacting protein [Puttea exsequens]
MADHTVRKGIRVVLDLEQPAKASDDEKKTMSTHAKGKLKREAIGKGGVKGLDVSYSRLKSHVEKSVSLLAGDRAIDCASCSNRIAPTDTTALTCPGETCNAAFHMSCLGSRFLSDEGDVARVLPISGICLRCRTELQWADLIKEMSLRVNGEEEVARLLKKPKGRKSKGAKIAEAQVRRNGSEDDPEETSFAAGVALDDDLPDNWHSHIDDDMMSTTSIDSVFSDSTNVATPKKAISTVPRLKTVIEDSDWSGAEVLDL